jgi:iron(III) transport system substrate-binding protein
MQSIHLHKRYGPSSGRYFYIRYSLFITRYLPLLLAAMLILTGCKRHVNSSSSSPADELVVYYSLDEEVAQPLLDRFQKETGIKVVARGDTEAAKTVGLIQRLRAEKASPLADVFWSGEIFYTIALADEGVLAPYASPAAADWPGQFAGKDGRWYGLAFRYRVIAYNTNRVKAAEAPRKLEDLLDPVWKGRLVMAQPLAGTTSSDVASWFAHYGAERAREILRGLAANQVRLVAGNSVSVRMVAQGQADVGLTDSDDAFAAQRNGWPVGYVVLDQDGRGPLAIPNSVALVAGAPHPQAARRFIDFVLGGTVERSLAESHQRNMPVSPLLAKEFAANRLAEPLAIDWVGVSSKLAEARAATQEILP